MVASFTRGTSWRGGISGERDELSLGHTDHEKFRVHMDRPVQEELDIEDEGIRDDQGQSLRPR